jgi:hypothetical protein
VLHACSLRCVSRLDAMAPLGPCVGAESESSHIWAQCCLNSDVLHTLRNVMSGKCRLLMCLRMSYRATNLTTRALTVVRARMS